MGFGLGKSVTALSWRTGDDIVVLRSNAEHPVSFVNLDGVNSDAPAAGLTLPAHGSAAVYVTPVVDNALAPFPADCEAENAVPAPLAQLLDPPGPIDLDRIWKALSPS